MASFGAASRDKPSVPHVLDNAHGLRLQSKRSCVLCVFLLLAKQWFCGSVGRLSHNGPSLFKDM